LATLAKFTGFLFKFNGVDNLMKHACASLKSQKSQEKFIFALKNTKMENLPYSKKLSLRMGTLKTQTLSG
jgi:hypothetical protein